MKPNEQEYSGFCKVMSETSQRKGAYKEGQKKKDVHFKNFLKIKALVRSNTEHNETNKKGQKLLRREGQDVWGGLATMSPKDKNNGQQTNDFWIGYTLSNLNLNFLAQKLRKHYN